METVNNQLQKFGSLLAEDTRARIQLLNEERDPTFLRTESCDVTVMSLISGRDDDERSDARFSLKGSAQKADAPAPVSIQSMDFEETESYAWRMHHVRFLPRVLY